MKHVQLLRLSFNLSYNTKSIINSILKLAFRFKMSTQQTKYYAVNNNNNKYLNI